MFTFIAKNSKGVEKSYPISGRHFGLIVGQATVGDIVNKYVEQWGVTPVKVLDSNNQEIQIDFKEASPKPAYEVTYQNSKGDTKTTRLSGKVMGREVTDSNILKLATIKTGEWGASVVSVTNPEGQVIADLKDAVVHKLQTDKNYTFNHSNGHTTIANVEGQLEVWIRTPNNQSEIVFSGDPNEVLTDEFITAVSKPGFGKELVNSVIFTETKLPQLAGCTITHSQITMTDDADITDYGFEFDNDILTTLSSADLALEKPLEM